MTLPRTANAALPSAPFKTAARAQPVFCYAVSAEASPGLLPRVIGLFAKRDLVPRRCHAATGGADGSDLEIDMQVSGRDRATADLVARGLRQIFGVHTVLLSEKI